MTGIRASRRSATQPTRNTTNRDVEVRMIRFPTASVATV